MILRRCLWAVLIVSQAGVVSAADGPFPESMITLRAQPAVFATRALLDVQLVRPQSVTLNLNALKADLAATKAAGGDQLTDADRYWLLVIANPGKYLIASKEKTLETLPNTMISSASAFAISREGILLTNAHAVCDVPARPWSPDNTVILDTLIARDGANFEKILGIAKLPNEAIEKLWLSLRTWYAAHSQFAGAKFKSARIVLSYKVSLKKQMAMQGRSLTEMLNQKPEEISVPATILAIGEALPGKDIAVLKATFEPEEQARLNQLSKQRNSSGLDAMLASIQNDRMVCLPLGNSDDVLPQAKVLALGFPDIAFNPKSMDAEAQFRVSSRSGQLSQTKRMNGSGGWDAFEMNTAIEHGDSGGPVLDMQGNVIAINVGTAQDVPGALRLAVPINLAKPLLAKARITPHPGKLSEHWDQGLRLFAGEKYATAQEQFMAAMKLQGGGVPGREVNSYLKEMNFRCAQKLGQVPGGK